jgi:alpha-glucosidase (family GH31 glycosyl hydrolase)
MELSQKHWVAVEMISMPVGPQMLENLGLSGHAFAGADAGGHAGTPAPELLTKWLEVSSFRPPTRVSLSGPARIRDRLDSFAAPARKQMTQEHRQVLDFSG